VAVPQQVEDAVDQEEGRLPLEGVARPCCLAGSRLHGDDHVPQEARVAGRSAPFPLGKGQDIGGMVLTPVAAVQGADAELGDEEAADLGLRTAQGA
jgi:hypothetical protein